MKSCYVHSSGRKRSTTHSEPAPQCRRLAEVPRRLPLTIVAVALLAGFASFPGQAANLLLNSSFEQNNGQFVPSSWTFFMPSNIVGVKDYWIVDSNSVGCSHMNANSGRYFWKEWFIHNGTNNVAGL